MRFQRIKPVFAVLLCALTLFAAAVPAQAEEYTVLGNGSEVTLPIPGYGPGAYSNNCWAFAQTVYEKIWGQNFTGDRGTDDDLLREVPAGSARAITEENLRAFITEARVGAVVRITTVIDGSDLNGYYKHSFILAQKDENGFTTYEGSINGRVRMMYYTWREYAEGYFGRHYGYFKYIKWPGAPVFGAELPEDAPVTCVAALHTPDYTPGDADSDGDLTPADARFALRASLGLEDLTVGTAGFLACDVNSSGGIEPADARMIMLASLGLAELETDAA